MKPEAQDIAIARLLGAEGPFTHLCYWPRTARDMVRDTVPNCQFHNSDEKPGHVLGPIPYFTTNLNAMHVAEKLVCESSKPWSSNPHDHEPWAYMSILGEICGVEPQRHEGLCYWPRHSIFVAIRATAAQRAEALLKTLKKWEGPVEESEVPGTYWPGGPEGAPPGQGGPEGSPIPFKATYPWLEQARLLHEAGKVDQALDVVFNMLDSLLWSKEDSPANMKNLSPFGYETVPLIAGQVQVNDLMIRPEVLDLPTDLLLGIITVTMPARAYLYNRKILAEKAREVFKARGIAADLLAHMPL